MTATLISSARSAVQVFFCQTTIGHAPHKMVGHFCQCMCAKLLLGSAAKFRHPIMLQMSAAQHNHHNCPSDYAFFTAPAKLYQIPVKPFVAFADGFRLGMFGMAEAIVDLKEKEQHSKTPNRVVLIAALPLLSSSNIRTLNTNIPFTRTMQLGDMQCILTEMVSLNWTAGCNVF